MGLFSKEECFCCGKRVGALSRIKIKSGEFLCTDCQKNGHPFIHVAEMTKDEVEKLFSDMKESEAHFQDVRFQFRKTSRMTFGKEWTFYDNLQTGEFALETPETKAYPNHYVYQMRDVIPYGETDRFLASGTFQDNPEMSRRRYYDLIKVEERKGSDGKTDSWILRMPYDRPHMKIETKFPGSMEEKDVRLLQAAIQSVIGSYNTGINLTPTQFEEIKKAGKSLGNDAAVTNTSELIGSMLSSLKKK
ncbi:MAG: DUF4428 domain-containing protein [Clostridia bacterium]|nr:DUF4428 domain-containing protein [Clostridia bacterium]